MTEEQRAKVEKLFKTSEEYSENLEQAKTTAIELMNDNLPNASDLFFEKDLKKIEEGIKKLNDYSSKCWLISAVTLYSLIFDKGMYTQSGLSWEEYMKDSRARLGLDPRETTEQLSSARFFIKNHEALKRAGWTPIGNARKLSRAELAYKLCNNLDEVIDHLVHDSWRDFKNWYQRLKVVPILTDDSIKTEKINQKDYRLENGVFKIGGVQAVSVNSALDEEDRVYLTTCLQKIFDALKAGYEPAIIPVYDNNEANALLRLRDKNRQTK